MKKILVYLKDYKKESVIAPLFKMLEAIFELIVPLVVAQIIDIGISNSDTLYILSRCGVLFLLAVIGLTCAVCAQFFAARAAVGFASQLRSALFSHIQTLSYADMDEIGTSTLMNRMTSDVNQLQSGVNMVLRLFMRSPFVVFGAMIMAFTVDVKGALMFVVVIPLLSVVVFGVMLITMPMYKKVQAALDKVLGKTRENLVGARVIRAFNKEEKEIEEFNKSNEILTNMQLMGLNPMVVFLTTIMYTVRVGINWKFPFIAGALFLPTIFLFYTFEHIVYAITYAVIAYAALALGALIRRLLDL